MLPQGYFNVFFLKDKKIALCLDGKMFKIKKKMFIFSLYNIDMYIFTNQIHN